MPDFDLSNCEREPIHIPGQIQSHGLLIVVDQQRNISHCSDNVFDWFGKTTAELLGKPLSTLEEMIGSDCPSGCIADLLSIGKIHKGFEQINPFEIKIAGKDYYLILSTAADTYYLLEFEPVVTDAQNGVQKMMGHSVAKLLSDKNLQRLLDNTVLQVKKTIQYDRVMVYRFAEDGHGEVVSEARNEGLDAWLGLHYPASDIPKQARELYKLNLTRLIADVNAVPSRISTTEAHIEPLDLTHSQLRAVSPVHIQYLKNMGVASSFSISILSKGELWGLIACHNYTPRFIDYQSRESSKLLGQILSSTLEFRQDEVQQQAQEVFKSNLDKLTKQLQETESIEEALSGFPVNLLDITHASGAVLLYEKKMVKMGLSPDDEQLGRLMAWLKDTNTKPLYHLTNLSSVFPEAAAYSAVASGILVVTLSKELEEYVIFFKSEQLQFISWAGNPEKPAVVQEDGLMKISPRNSFKEWSQTVTATSLPWRPEEIASAMRLKEEISYALNQKAGAIRLMNDKLQQAYEELDTFSYTISHDLKNPIAAIKSYAQLLARNQGFTDRDQMLLGRIADRADQMKSMIHAVLEHSRLGRSDINYVSINTSALIADILKDLNLLNSSGDLEITVGETPDLMGDPTMMMQVFSNLIGNAVKYSGSRNPARVHIEGQISETEICYTISDNGLGIAQKDLANVFGLFSRMENVKDIEGSGVGLAIVKRIVEKHNGRIWVESGLDTGSVFHVCFERQAS